MFAFLAAYPPSVSPGPVKTFTDTALTGGPRWLGLLITGIVVLTLAALVVVVVGKIRG